MRNIETFPSKQMYPYLSLVERKVAEFYHNIDRRRWLVWLKWLIFINFSGQLMVSLGFFLLTYSGGNFWTIFEIQFQSRLALFVGHNAWWFSFITNHNNHAHTLYAILPMTTSGTLPTLHHVSYVQMVPWVWRVQGKSCEVQGSTRAPRVCGLPAEK